MSFGLPPKVTCPVQGEVCKTCYAHYGMANMTNVAVNLRENLELVEQFEKSGDIFGLVDALEAVIPADVEYFRWFWSGDCFTPVLAQAIWFVALHRPNTLFWVSTRTAFFDGFEPLINLTVRNSTRAVNDFRIPSAPISVAMVALPGVQTPEHIWECPGGCGTCRVCWSHKDAIVAYRWHGSATARCRLGKGMKQGWFSAPKGMNGEVRHD